MAQGPSIKTPELGLKPGRDSSPRIEDMSLEEVECFSHQEGHGAP